MTFIIVLKISQLILPYEDLALFYSQSMKYSTQ